jgi:hypothetical protein
VRFCPDHWTALRHAVALQNLDALIAETGESAAANLISEMAKGSTIDNFDPLMGAHNAIVAQAMTIIKERYTQNPLMVMADDTEHPEWACPICALNWCHEEHARLCTQVDCNWPPTFDWTDEMVDGAADLMLDRWKAMRP